MPLGRIFFGKLPALALLRDHLHNDRAFNPFDIFKDIEHLGKVMAVEGAEEFEAKFLEDGAALAVHDKLLEAGLGSPCRLARFAAHDRQFLN